MTLLAGDDVLAAVCGGLLLLGGKPLEGCKLSRHRGADDEAATPFDRTLAGNMLELCGEIKHEIR